jgi:hypothetical protein
LKKSIPPPLSSHGHSSTDSSVRTLCGGSEGLWLYRPSPYSRVPRISPLPRSLRKWLISAPRHECRREGCIALVRPRLTYRVEHYVPPIGSRVPRTCRERAQLPIEDFSLRLGEPYARKSCTYGSWGGHPSIKNILFPSLWSSHHVPLFMGPEVRKHFQGY